MVAGSLTTPAEGKHLEIHHEHDDRCLTQEDDENQIVAIKIVSIDPEIDEEAERDDDE